MSTENKVCGPPPAVPPSCELQPCVLSAADCHLQLSAPEKKWGWRRGWTKANAHFLTRNTVPFIFMTLVWHRCRCSLWCVRHFGTHESCWTSVHQCSWNLTFVFCVLSRLLSVGPFEIISFYEFRINELWTEWVYVELLGVWTLSVV